MRTRSADEDLVVVDLDDPDELATRGPDALRLHFEDHYAELPFGLGTVARRLEPDPWYTRPGVLLWVAIALVGLLALAGSDDPATDADRPSSEPTPAPTYPVLTEETDTALLFAHLDVVSRFDVDSGTFQVVTPGLLAPRRTPPPALVSVATPVGTDGRHPLVVQSPRGPYPVAADGEALALGDRSVVWRPTRCTVCAVRLTDVPSRRTTTLGRATGAPHGVALAPDGRAVGLLASAGPGRVELRLVRASGRPIARVPLPVDLVATPMLWSRDSRWLFAISGATLLVLDARSGDVRRVGNTLPPFESITTE